MKKAFIIVSVILIIGVIYILNEINSGYNENIATIDNFDKKNYYLVENEFLVKLPESSVIENVSLINGKDQCLSVRIALNESEVTKFNQSIGFNTESYTESYTESNPEKVITSKNTKSFMKIKYYAPQDSKREIDLIKYQPIGKEIVEIMQAAGFNSIKSR